MKRARDADAEAIRQLFPEAPILEADATRDETLVQARIGLARGLVASLSADTDNLFVCLSARDLQPNLTIVARAHDEDPMQKLYKAGADHVVSRTSRAGSAWRPCCSVRRL
ncbi:MAG: NAD(P)-binding protein [Gemmatimonadota bacterium]